MSDKDKTLCKWKKDSLTENFQHFAEIVSSPCYVCKRCRRVATGKKWLCSAVAIAQISSKSAKKKLKKKIKVQIAAQI